MSSARKFVFATYHPSDPAIAGRDDRPAVAKASEKLLRAMRRAFDDRAIRRGVTPWFAQIHLMNGVEP